MQEWTPEERQAARAAAAAATAAARAAAAAGTASINRGPWASTGGGSVVIGGGNGGGGHSNENQLEKARRQVGRWSGEEVAALIEGVLLHGTSWSTIHETCVATGRINPGRKQVGPMARSQLAGTGQCQLAWRRQFALHLGVSVYLGAIKLVTGPAGWLQQDLKDKWRNLVKLASDPLKQARSVDLTGEQQQGGCASMFALR